MEVRLVVRERIRRIQTQPGDDLTPGIVVIGSDRNELGSRGHVYNPIHDALRPAVQDLGNRRDRVADAGRRILDAPRRRRIGWRPDEIHEPRDIGNRFAEQAPEHGLPRHTVFPQPHFTRAVGMPVVGRSRTPLILAVDGLRPTEHHVAGDPERRFEYRVIDVGEALIAGHIPDQLV